MDPPPALPSRHVLRYRPCWNWHTHGSLNHREVTVGLYWWNVLEICPLEFLEIHSLKNWGSSIIPEALCCKTDHSACLGKLLATGCCQTLHPAGAETWRSRGFYSSWALGPSRTAAKLPVLQQLGLGEHITGA